jgi:hypothetical protein
LNSAGLFVEKSILENIRKVKSNFVIRPLWPQLCLRTSRGKLKMANRPFAERSE